MRADYRGTTSTSWLFLFAFPFKRAYARAAYHSCSFFFHHTLQPSQTMISHPVHPYFSVCESLSMFFRRSIEFLTEKPWKSTDSVGLWKTRLCAMFAKHESWRWLMWIFGQLYVLLWNLSCCFCTYWWLMTISNQLKSYNVLFNDWLFHFHKSALIIWFSSTQVGAFLTSICRTSFNGLGDQLWDSRQFSVIWLHDLPPVSRYQLTGFQSFRWQSSTFAIRPWLSNVWVNFLISMHCTQAF